MTLNRLNFTPTLSDDFMHFETHCDAYPTQAQAVFRCVDEFRNSLSAFRLATEQALPRADDALFQRTLSCDDEQATLSKHLPASDEQATLSKHLPASDEQATFLELLSPSDGLPSAVERLTLASDETELLADAGRMSPVSVDDALIADASANE